MRAMAKQIITDAAVIAGIPADNVIDKPEDANELLLSKPRVEFETVDEFLEDSRDLIAILPGNNPATHQKRRYKTHNEILKVRIAIKAETKAEVEAIYKTIVTKLPAKTADADNNLVSVITERARRSGFDTKTVDVFPVFEIAVWITITGMLCNDKEVAYIRDINLKDGISLHNFGG